MGDKQHLWTLPTRSRSIRSKLRNQKWLQTLTPGGGRVQNHLAENHWAWPAWPRQLQPPLPFGQSVNCDDWQQILKMKEANQEVVQPFTVDCSSSPLIAWNCSQTVSENHRVQSGGYHGSGFCITSLKRTPQRRTKLREGPRSHISIIQHQIFSYFLTFVSVNWKNKQLYLKFYHVNSPSLNIWNCDPLNKNSPFPPSPYFPGNYHSFFSMIWL